MTLSVLVVDDEAVVRTQIESALRRAGHEVTTARDGEEALTSMAETAVDVLITDVRMPRMNGLTLFHKVREIQPTLSVIVITGHAQVQDAVEAIQRGAYDYISKPFTPDELLVKVERLAETLSMHQELQEARALLRSRRREAGVQLIGRHSTMQALERRIDTIAPSDASVIIAGESGTGKELIARAMHARSLRHDGPFVAVNCAALPETLVEAELFGHEKGAFTGATHRRLGRFREASSGTLLLDEVGELPPSVQVKLLRVLQEHRVEPLGGRSVCVNVRIICATHRDLKGMVAAGRFREDLYYRLNVLSIRAPTLRERPGDIPLLIDHYYQKFSGGERSPEITPRAWAVLTTYPFPGNVRELEHAMQHAVIMSGGGPIDLSHLPPDLAGIEFDNERVPRGVPPLATSMHDFERHCLLQALSATHGRRKKAADMLGISRKTLWEKLKTHGISDSDLEDLGSAPDAASPPGASGPSGAAKVKPGLDAAGKNPKTRLVL